MNRPATRGSAKKPARGGGAVSANAKGRGGKGISKARAPAKKPAKLPPSAKSSSAKVTAPKNSGPAFRSERAGAKPGSNKSAPINLEDDDVMEIDDEHKTHPMKFSGSEGISKYMPKHQDNSVSFPYISFGDVIIIFDETNTKYQYRLDRQILARCSPKLRMMLNKKKPDEPFPELLDEIQASTCRIELKQSAKAADEWGLLKTSFTKWKEAPPAFVIAGDNIRSRSPPSNVSSQSPQAAFNNVAGGGNNTLTSPISSPKAERNTHDVPLQSFSNGTVLSVEEIARDNENLARKHPQGLVLLSPIFDIPASTKEVGNPTASPKKVFDFKNNSLRSDHDKFEISKAPEGLGLNASPYGLNTEEPFFLEDQDVKTKEALNTRDNFGANSCTGVEQPSIQLPVSSYAASDQGHRSFQEKSPPPGISTNSEHLHTSPDQASENCGLHENAEARPFTSIFGDGSVVPGPESSFSAHISKNKDENRENIQNLPSVSAPTTKISFEIRQPSVFGQIPNQRDSFEEHFKSGNSGRKSSTKHPVSGINIDGAFDLKSYHEKSKNNSFLDACKTHHNLFLMFYSLTPEICNTNIDVAVRDCELILGRAEVLQCEAIVAPFISSALLSFSRGLYEKILNDPWRYLRISIQICSAPIFKEAMVHLIGSYSRWSNEDRKQMDSLSVSVQNIIDAKIMRLAQNRNYINSQLCDMNMMINGDPVSLSIGPVNAFDSWMVLSIWHDYFRNNRPDSSHQHQGTFYRTLRAGGDAYLTTDSVCKTLSDINLLTPRRYFETLGSQTFAALTDAHIPPKTLARKTVFSKQNTFRDLAEDLQLMKEWASDLVKELCVNESMLDPAEHKITYLTCTKVDDHELPWARDIFS